MKTVNLITHSLPQRIIKYEVWSCYGSPCNSIRRGVFTTREDATLWKEKIFNIDSSRREDNSDTRYWVQVETPIDDVVEITGKGPESTTDIPPTVRFHGTVVSL